MAAIDHSAKNDEKRAQNEKSGRNNVDQDPEVGIAVRREQVQEEQQDERKQTAEKDDETGEAQPVSQMPLQPLQVHEAGRLFFERTNMSDQRLDLVVTQLL